MSAVNRSGVQDGDLSVEWPPSVGVGAPFEVRVRWQKSGEVELEPVPEAAQPGDLWGPFEARPLGPAVRGDAGGPVERHFELLLLEPPMDGAQLRATLNVSGPEVWLRPVGGGPVEARSAEPVALPLNTQVADAELVRFERLPWSFQAPAAPVWPLALVALGITALLFARAPGWLARRRAARERRVPLHALEAWLAASGEVDGPSLRAVSGHLRTLARSTADEDPDGLTVEEARSAGAPRTWSGEQRDVLWSWWSADQRWSYGGRLPDPAEAQALTEDLRRVLPGLRERIEVTS